MQTDPMLKTNIITVNILENITILTPGNEAEAINWHNTSYPVSKLLPEPTSNANQAHANCKNSYLTRKLIY